MKHVNDARSLVMMSYDKIEPMIWEGSRKAGVLLEYRKFVLFLAFQGLLGAPHIGQKPKED